MSTLFIKFMESFKKPLVSSGNIAVWPAKELKNGKKIYNVSFDNADKERNYISVFANIAGQELKPDEVLALSYGKNVRIEDETQYGRKIYTIINRGVETKIAEKDGNSYENNHMVLGIAFHKLTPEGKTFGYLCNGISFFAESGDLKSQREIYLTPQDCFKLLDGQPIIKDDNEAFLSYIEEVKAPSTNSSASEEKTYKTARLEITKNDCKYSYHLRSNMVPKEEYDTTMKL